MIVFVVKRNTLEKAALDLEIFITLQAAMEMVEIWIIAFFPTSPTTQRQSHLGRVHPEKSYILSYTDFWSAVEADYICF